MGRWDQELVKLLPESVKVYASAGAGFDWIDTACLADYGEWIPEIGRLGWQSRGSRGECSERPCCVFSIGCKLSFPWESSCSLKSPAFSFGSGLVISGLHFSSYRSLMRVNGLERMIEKLIVLDDGPV